MSTKQTTPKNMDQYVAGFPPDVQKILEEIRMTVRPANTVLYAYPDST